MKRLLFASLLMLSIVACSPLALLPTPVRPNPASPADDLALYRKDLVPAQQHVLDMLDRPTRYDLVLTYDPAVPTLRGTEHVRYVNRQAAPLNEIYFRLFANYPDSNGKISVSRVQVSGADVQPELEVQDTALRVPLGQPLEPGAELTFDLDFQVTIPQNAKGHYADFTADASVVTVPTIYPLIPAIDSKGWHLELPPAYGDLVYAEISLFRVDITAPAALTVIASGTAQEIKDNQDGTKTWEFVAAPVRDFDINLTDSLQVSSSRIGDITINSYYEPSHSASGRDALRFAADALRTYEKRFGAYPYRELDVVETPTTAGGIEYPGVVVIGRELYNNASQRQFFEFATVHEVSHQWWYGVVGDDQVNCPWVDEALAQYSSLIYEEDVRGANAARTVLSRYFQDLYKGAKDAGHDAAVNQPVSAFDEANYAAIVYGKGPLFYDAIRKKMGDDNFFAFLKSYYDQYRFKIAFPEDILKTAETSCSCSLQDEYSQWILAPQ